MTSPVVALDALVLPVPGASHDAARGGALAIEVAVAALVGLFTACRATAPRDLP